MIKPIQLIVRCAGMKRLFYLARLERHFGEKCEIDGYFKSPVTIPFI